jgi:hypothetical protein
MGRSPTCISYALCVTRFNLKSSFLCPPLLASDQRLSLSHAHTQTHTHTHAQTHTHTHTHTHAWVDEREGAKTRTATEDQNFDDNHII